MDDRFRTMVEALEGRYQELLAMDPVPADRIPSSAPAGGVFLFTEDDRHLYIGRTRQRIDVRVRHLFGSDPQTASLPWLIARHTTGHKATYQIAGSRAQLLADPEFRGEYESARERVRRMLVRYVHEPDPLRQALLEIYVAVATQAPYNDFEAR
jgi:hypothetical protein